MDTAPAESFRGNAPVLFAIGGLLVVAIDSAVQTRGAGALRRT